MALQLSINRGNKSLNYALPSPTGGLNMRDSFDKIDATQALVMDNYMPLDTCVALRKGYKRFADINHPVKTLVEFNALTTHTKLFAFAGGNIYDITNPSDIITTEKSFSSDVFQTCQFKNYLVAVNGIDAPQTYHINDDGEGVWEALDFDTEESVTLNINKLVNVSAVKQRLWFVEKGSMKVWYSANAAEISGTLKFFDFTTIATRGGYLVNVANWTQDGGQGMDDLTVFLTSEGEALIYKGINPNSADDWSLVGVYRISKPVGYKCILPYQGDVIIICEDGYMPLSKVITLQGVNTQKSAFSDRIRNLVSARMKTGKDKEGWQGILYSRGGYAVFNVPTSQQFEQHVVNLTTGAWCRFTDIRSYCWGLYQGLLYFGTDDGVMLYDVGYSDNGVEIKGHVEQAYCDLGTSYLKKVQLINPRTKSSIPFQLVIYTNTDFDTQLVDYIENIGHIGDSAWDTVKWSSKALKSGTRWATLQSNMNSQWIGNNATGFKFSIVFKTKTKGTLIEWYDTGLRYETGSGII